MHDHKTCMKLFILETCHRHVFESGLKMANGFKCWKGEGMRKGENKGKSTLHVCAAALMWLHKSPFLKISDIERVDNGKDKLADVWKRNWMERVCSQVGALWSYKGVLYGCCKGRESQRGFEGRTNELQEKLGKKGFHKYRNVCGNRSWKWQREKWDNGR